jgi:hypothetical protein
MNENTGIATVEQIEQAILLLRGQKVMLDRDLAALYGVETKVSTERCGAILTVFQRISCSNSLLMRRML